LAEDFVDELIPLGDLAAGQAARIHRILGHADYVHRLEEFGLRRGIQIQMFRRGNPCIIRLAGNKVCLRADAKLHVLVQPIEGGQETVAT
jgi:Fe2+ transport system protein FeoA